MIVGFLGSEINVGLILAKCCTVPYTHVIGNTADYLERVTMTTYRLLVGYGDYSCPEDCWGVEWATDDDDNEYTFTYEADALLFASTVYEAKIENNPNWQSYWVYVTDSATIDEAMNEWDMRA